jgi:hypothetical protein
VLQEGASGTETIFSVANVSFKRDRSTTLIEDEAASDDVSPTLSRKRQRICEKLQSQTPGRSWPSEKAGKARADLSPATEAAVHQIPKKIKKAIKALEAIGMCVNGLLEFKAILDHQQLEVDQKFEQIQCRGPSALNHDPGDG